MRQRVMIAMALACEPELLIADEPTTALDVTVQAQILDLLRSLVRERGMALLLITHDLGVVRELCERAVVLYAGRSSEEAPVTTCCARRSIRTRPGSGRASRRSRRAGARLPQIPGTPPDPAALPAGCAFAPRCPAALERVPRHAAAPGADAGPPARPVIRSHELRQRTLEHRLGATDMTHAATS